MTEIKVGDIVEVDAEYPGIKDKKFRGIVTKISSMHTATLIHIRYPKRLMKWENSPHRNNIIVSDDYVKVIA